MTDPARAGAYEVGELLGSGGFGEVFRARHPVIGRVVAIKVLHAKYSKDGDAVARFVAEARAVNVIKHPGIVEIYDFGELSDGRAYCVMELVEGKTLRDVLRERGKLPVTEALPILRDVAEAIDAAHAAGIAHRDLKPDNVFVTAHGVKVIDFGLAKLTTDQATQITETGAVFGTPLYMSPEQCRGKATTTATDAYSFGVLAYHLLVGKPPFTGEPLELALRHLNDQPPPTNLDPRVDRVVLALMAKDPAQRPPLLVEAVAAIAGDAALPRKPRTRRSRAWLALPALALAGAGAFALWPRAPADDCATPQARLEGIWDATTRGRIADKFAAAHKHDVDATWRVVAAELDHWTDRFSRQWVAACHAPDRKTDPLLYGQRLTCLENALVSVRGVVAATPGDDVAAFSDGYSGLSALPVLGDCETTSTLRAQAPAPAPEVRARIAALVGEVEAGRVELRAATNAHRDAFIEPGMKRLATAADELAALKAPEAAYALNRIAYYQTWLAGSRPDEWLDRAGASVARAVRTAQELRNDLQLPVAYSLLVEIERMHHDDAKVSAAMEQWAAANERAGRPQALVAEYAKMQAKISIDHKQWDAAREQLDKAAALYAKLEAPTYEIEMVAFPRSELEVGAGRYAEAEKTMRELVASRTRTWGPDQRPTIVARLGLYTDVLRPHHPEVAGVEIREIIAADQRVGAAKEELVWAWSEYLGTSPDAAGRSEAIAALDKLVPDRSWLATASATLLAHGLVDDLDELVHAVAGKMDDASQAGKLAFALMRGYVALVRGDPTGAEAPAREALALEEAAHQANGAGCIVAFVEASAGHADAALAAARRELAAGGPTCIGYAYWLIGRWRDAITADRESLKTMKERDSRYAETEALLGDALVHDGKTSDAIAPLEDSLAIVRDCCNGSHYYAPVAEFALARAIAATDQPRAKRLAEQARDHFAKLGPHLDVQRAAAAAFASRTRGE